MQTGVIKANTLREQSLLGLCSGLGVESQVLCDITNGLCDRCWIIHHRMGFHFIEVFQLLFIHL